MIMAASGNVALAPDSLGYGASYDYFKRYVSHATDIPVAAAVTVLISLPRSPFFTSYLVKKAYQTSAIPLWLKAQQLIVDETGCETELANTVVVSGYSEGGYGSVAIAQALDCLGVEIIKLQAGGGPYKLASRTLADTHGECCAFLIPWADGRRALRCGLTRQILASLFGL